MNAVRYGVYLASLDPTRGSEMAKTRPVVVVCNRRAGSRLFVADRKSPLLGSMLFRDSR
jgi:mRNA-degrading endonuclease toxin of MazEF toxin-antitoxin module